MPAYASTRRKKAFYHQTFAMKDGTGKEILRHTLLVNPEDMSFAEPSKSTYTETLGGGYLSDFGSAAKTVTIQGITGYKVRKNAEGVERDGFTEFMHFRNDFYRKYIESSDPQLTAYWYNWEDDDYWRIHLTNFRLMRNKNEPLLYRYEFSFTLLHNLTAGKGAKVPQPAIDFNTILKNLSASLSGLSEATTVFST